MKNSEIFAQITWTRQDIRQLLEDHDLESTRKLLINFWRDWISADLRKLVLRMPGNDCPGDCVSRACLPFYGCFYKRLQKKKLIFSYWKHRGYNKSDIISFCFRLNNTLI